MANTSVALLPVLRPIIWHRRWLGVALLAAAFFGAAGCVTHSNEDATIGIADAAGLQTSYIAAGDFELLVARVPAVGNSDATLRVYIAGDGTPWRGGDITMNPGPFQPLAIRLMLRDPTPSLFLGRPCYHQSSHKHDSPPSHESTGCRPSVWSFERYSARVVDSMAIALRQISSDAQGARLTLVGYSGGGVLATLLAHQVEVVDRLVTVAAPLDVAAWSRLHNYTPLLGSLDPALLPPLRRPLEQIHLHGANDQEVPPTVARLYFVAQEIALDTAKQPSPRRVLEGHNHRCCWLPQWPQLLQDHVAPGP